MNNTAQKKDSIKRKINKIIVNLYNFNFTNFQIKTEKIEKLK